MEQSFYIGVRVGKRTHDALRKRQQASKVEVSLSALVRHLLNESLGIESVRQQARRLLEERGYHVRKDTDVKKKNGKGRR